MFPDCSKCDADSRMDNGRIDIDIDLQSKFLSKFFTYGSRTDVTATLSPPDYEQSQSDAPTPVMNIVIQVVGSRGDVQPFVSLGQALQRHGHRVRLATHPVFKRLVESHGLQFFDIGGDPSELMAYMVKNPGLMPKLATLRSGEVQKRRQAMHNVMNGCWRSCVESGDGSGLDGTRDGSARRFKDSKPFVADAIIANPPSFAHIHCAERLGIPLHLIFTMPWSPTDNFPHPLANIRSSDTEKKLANYLSYILVDMMAWQGLGDVINRFRRKTLNLDPVHPTWAPVMIQRLQVPHTYCWSPALIPKPQDWASHITIAGFFFLSGSDQYNPPDDLVHFLKQDPPPIYIGFGSIVVDDPAALSELVFSAIRLAGVRAVVSRGWGNIGDSHNAPAEVFMLGDCPHDWLFEHVSCVVHHGGAGTTAAGIKAGKPSVVVPFFGDQPFWGDMIYKTGAGPKPVDFARLTPEGLAEAITAALRPEILENARNLGESIGEEDGAENGVQSFHKHLPLRKMRCDLAPERVAAWQLRKGKKIIKLSALAATLLRKGGVIEFGDLKIHKPSVQNLDHGPWEPVSGFTLSVLDVFQEAFIGIGEIGSEFMHVPYVGYKGKGKARAREIQNWSDPDVSASQRPEQSPSPPEYREKGNDDKTIVGVRAAKGLGRIVKATVRAPMTATVAMAKGSDNAMRLMGDKTVRPQQEITGIGSGLAVAGKTFAFNVFDGLSGLVTQPLDGARDAGVAGGLAGSARGVLGLPLKWWSGMNGLVGYPMKGLDAQIKALGKTDLKKGIKSSRMAQGEWEYAEADPEVRKRIMDNWRRLDLGSVQGEED